MSFPEMSSLAPGRVPVARPAPDVLFERRRSQRRNLQRPAEVRLRGVGDETEWSCMGAVLNVGIDGIAARVTTENAMRLLVDQHVDVVFRLGSWPTEFDLRARVTNVTPAGTDHHRVLGLEFVEGRRLQESRPALREAITQAVDSKG